ncbi:MAG: nickel insertion protein [Anaerovoracaceae bacterium]
MIIRLNCENGVNGYLIKQQLAELLNYEESVNLVAEPKGKSLKAIVEYISNQELEKEVKDFAIKTYTIIGKAEAEVHGETLETVHFHEVGRFAAVKNIIEIEAIIFELKKTEKVEIVIGKIFDGFGWTTCSHGEISVPVPAVQVMKKQCNYIFSTQGDKELVTPRGLALLIALEARQEIE